MKRKQGAASILVVSLLMLGACSKNVELKSESTTTTTNTVPDNPSNVQSTSGSTPTLTNTEPNNNSSIDLRSDSSPSTTNDRTNKNVKGETMFEINGVQITIDPSLGSGYSTRTRSSTSITVNSQSFNKSSTSSSKIDVNGRQVEIVNGNLRISGQSYGQVKSGDKVLITAKGVQVNGKERGSLTF